MESAVNAESSKVISVALILTVSKKADQLSVAEHGGETGAHRRQGPAVRPVAQFQCRFSMKTPPPCVFPAVLALQTAPTHWREAALMHVFTLLSIPIPFVHGCCRYHTSNHKASLGSLPVLRVQILKSLCTQPYHPFDTFEADITTVLPPIHNVKLDSYPGRLVTDHVELLSFFSPCPVSNFGTTTPPQECNEKPHTQIISSHHAGARMEKPTESVLDPMEVGDELSRFPTAGQRQLQSGDGVSQESLHYLHSPSHNKERIDMIESQQDELRDTRDELLGSRFKLQFKRKELRKVRQEASVKEGSLFSQLRQFRQLLVDKGIDIPEQIENVYSEASDLRDRHGELEDDYDQAEAEYNLLEWKYTQKETKFIDSLAEDWTTTYASSERGEKNRETEDLTRFALGVPEVWDGPTHFSGLGPIVASIPLPKIIDHTGSVVPMAVSLDPMIQLGSTSLLESPRATSMIDLAPPSHRNESVSLLPHPTSENDLFQARLAWADARRRIDSWIFETLSCSRLQKARLRSLHSRDELDDFSWWNLVIEYWSLDDSDSPILDLEVRRSLTTRETASPPVSSPPTSILFGNSGPDNHAQRSDLPMTLLPEERVVDALNAPTMPTIIEPSDLLDDILEPTTGQTCILESSNKEVEASKALAPKVDSAVPEFTEIDHGHFFD
ncbi:uncharacterized protein BDR25DRAFT_361522 [Lindgomyces ingoldianus]|uniref:Uncharacterized protein n=1 Tax=Lindgomyces ingoldianus TaxID=673940 RepID=A0ACB6QC33_9PLEO|nr:uncharacterized protein BDR25DRAFT_361522 [Lindgomyces ingoldianus]KAF2464456.1 hypothetical protein BDR25DRAFT_361522 [Lindgomyces ingoldianus]